MPGLLRSGMGACALPREGARGGAAQGHRPRNPSICTNFAVQLAWHPRRQHVLLSADARGTLAIWSVESAEVCLVWSHSGPVEAAACVAWHPLQGTYFAAGGADGKASVWDLARSTRFPLSTSTLGCPVTTLAWSPDGRALVCGGEAGAITALAWSAPDLTEGGSQDGAEGNDAVLRVLTESRHESSRM